VWARAGDVGEGTPAAGVVEAIAGVAAAVAIEGVEVARRMDQIGKRKTSWI